MNSNCIFASVPADLDVKMKTLVMCSVFFMVRVSYTFNLIKFSDKDESKETVFCVLISIHKISSEGANDCYDIDKIKIVDADCKHRLSL